MICRVAGRCARQCSRLTYPTTKARETDRQGPLHIRNEQLTTNRVDLCSGQPCRAADLSALRLHIPAARRDPDLRRLLFRIRVLPESWCCCSRPSSNLVGAPAIIEGRPADLRRLLFPVRRQLPAPDGDAILYIEVALVIINGALLWLLFKDKTPTKYRRRMRGYWPEAHPRRAEKVTGCGAGLPACLPARACSLVIA
jgi:hypothetical protein